MTPWTALVPVKAPAARKTRLAGAIGPADRVELGAQMLGHVLDVLARCPEIAEVVVLSPLRPAGRSERWIADKSRGLNAELTAAARMLNGPLLVVHADLPDLACADISALIEAAGKGVAIAPDHLGTGTNALAARDSRDLAFHFGPGSFARHCAQFGAAAVRVDRPGLAHDLDSPEDLARYSALAASPRK